MELIEDNFCMGRKNDMWTGLIVAQTTGKSGWRQYNIPQVTGILEELQQAYSAKSTVGWCDSMQGFLSTPWYIQQQQHFSTIQIKSFP